MVKKDSNRAATQLVQAIGISAMSDTNDTIRNARSDVYKELAALAAAPNGYDKHERETLLRERVMDSVIRIRESLDRMTPALSARASAGEGGGWTEKARQMIAELRDYVVNERDAQVLPRKAASYQRQLDDIDALLTAAPQPAQAGDSGGGEDAENVREAVDREVRGGRIFYFRHNPPNTMLAQTFNSILLANGTYEVDNAKNAAREEAARAQLGVLATLPTTPASPATGDKRHVGDSKFESWYADYCRTDWPDGTKQIARDAYAAGMGDATPQPAAAQGWVMVPREPTAEMIEAAMLGHDDLEETWAAMLAAAPQPQEAAPVRDFPAQFFASGPEGEFFTNSHAFAETMITASGRDRDEWTITDLSHPTPTDESGPGRESTVADDTARLDFIERTFSGVTNRERYLPVQMVWGKGCNGRTLREACDKYMKRDTALALPAQGEGNNG